MNTRPKSLFIAFSLLVVIGLVMFQAGRFFDFATSPAQPGSEEQIVIEIHRGQTALDISKKFEAEHLVTSGQWFRWLGKINRSWAKIKAGEYGVSPGMSPSKLLEIITSGISLSHPFTIKEGDNIYDIASGLEGMGFGTHEKVLALLHDSKFIGTLGFESPAPTSLEGYLFPETYFLNKTMNLEAIIRPMVKKFQAAWGTPEKTRAHELGLTRSQLITLASIVEKETGAPQERPMIASIFYNRLHKKMKLQSDPTTIYAALNELIANKRNIHKADLSSENGYNTYYIPGLPIGPISNPGKDAIQAVLHPAETDFLFFVSHNDGTHEFTKSYGEHLKAVKKFQLDPKAREGKSWRDLKTKANSTQ